MRMFDSNQFQLEVRHLDSKGATSEGWIVFKGSCDFEPISGKPDCLRILLKSDDPSNSFTYDEKLFTRGVNFGLSCFKRVASAILKAFNLELDVKTDVITVSPASSVLKMFWETSVGLFPTAEGSLWKPHSIKTGFKGPLPSGCAMQPEAATA